MDWTKCSLFIYLKSGFLLLSLSTLLNAANAQTQTKKRKTKNQKKPQETGSGILAQLPHCSTLPVWAWATGVLWGASQQHHSCWHYGCIWSSENTRWWKIEENLRRWTHPRLRRIVLLTTTMRTQTPFEHKRCPVFAQTQWTTTRTTRYLPWMDSVLFELVWSHLIS